MARKKWCLDCKWRPQEVHRRCKTCYEYRRRTGERRPLEAIVSHYRRVTGAF